MHLRDTEDGPRRAIASSLSVFTSSKLYPVFHCSLNSHPLTVVDLIPRPPLDIESTCVLSVHRDRITQRHLLDCTRRQPAVCLQAQLIQYGRAGYANILLADNTYDLTIAAVLCRLSHQKDVSISMQHRQRASENSNKANKDKD